MTHLEEAANQIAGNMVENNSLPKEKAFDPAVILTISEVIIRLINSCRAAENLKNAVGACNSPGLFQRRALKIQIKRAMGKELFKEHGDQVFDAMLKYGTKVDETILKKLIFDAAMAE